MYTAKLHDALANNTTLVNLDLRHNKIEDGSACVSAIKVCVDLLALVVAIAS